MKCRPWGAVESSVPTRRLQCWTVQLLGKELCGGVCGRQIAQGPGVPSCAALAKERLAGEKKLNPHSLQACHPLSASRPSLLSLDMPGFLAKVPCPQPFLCAFPPGRGCCRNLLIQVECPAVSAFSLSSGIAPHCGFCYPHHRVCVRACVHVCVGGCTRVCTCVYTYLYFTYITLCKIFHS